MKVLKGECRSREGVQAMGGDRDEMREAKDDVEVDARNGKVGL